MARQAFRGARRFGGRTQRQPTTWARSVGGTQVLVAASTKVLLQTLSLSNPGIGETVRRTRGEVLLDSASGGPQLGALGFVVVSDLAVAAGAASIPGPVTDSSDDGWFVWFPLMNHVVSSGNFSQNPIEFDSKAMRRVEEGFTIAVMVENASASRPLEVSLGFSLLSSLS